MKQTRRFMTAAALIAVAVPGAIWARGNVDGIPGVEDGPAMSADAARMTSLGFSDLNGVHGTTTQGDGLSLSVEAPDGRYLQLQMDPISGELSQSGSKSHR